MHPCVKDDSVTYQLSESPLAPALPSAPTSDSSTGVACCGQTHLWFGALPPLQAVAAFTSCPEQCFGLVTCPHIHSGPLHPVLKHSSQSYVFQMRAILSACLGSPASPGGLAPALPHCALIPPAALLSWNFTFHWAVLDCEPQGAGTMLHPCPSLDGTWWTRVLFLLTKYRKECEMEPMIGDGGGEMRLERWEELV